MAQLNFLVGDIDGNAKLVIANAEKAIAEHTADVIVFPELTLTGYPLEDLLLRPSLQVRINKALASSSNKRQTLYDYKNMPDIHNEFGTKDAEKHMILDTAVGDSKKQYESNYLMTLEGDKSHY